MDQDQGYGTENMYIQRALGIPNLDDTSENGPPGCRCSQS